MENNIEITNHAFDRAKERLSLNRKSFQRLAEKAFSDGLKHSDVKGRLHRYLDKTFLEYRQASNIRIYGENMFLFRDNVLITVYLVPNELRKNLKVFKT